jgi:hypothetical protein
MKDSDKKILMVLAAIAILVLTIVFVVRPKNESIKGLKSEVAQLQDRYDDLCEKENHKDEFIAETKEFNEKFDEIVADYPADLNQETTVMFMKGVEEENDFINDAFSMPEDTAFYVLGEGSVDNPEDIAEGEGEEAPYVCSSNAYSITYNGSYDGLKDYLDYIANYKYRMAISSFNISYDAEAPSDLEECSGSVVLNAYSISGPGREPEVPSVDVSEGKSNIFAGTLGSGRTGGAAVSYDSDEGASIVSSHSLVVLLNNANNDTSSGIIVASDESNEGSYVTSSENSVQALSISIDEEDGKNYVTYKIGSSEQKAEILSKDVTIYVKSSARVDSDDQNGVDVTINNSTDLGVYIKVVNDDSTSPRFNVKQKSGTVKVY